MRPGTLRRWSAGLAVIGLITLVACSPGADKSARSKPATDSKAADSRGSTAQAQAVPGKPALAGDSPQAWLGGRGDAGDSNYCDAKLKLPLSRQPAWEWKYSAAELSDNNLSHLLHYDGLLLTTAFYSAQLVGLDTRSGKQRFNQPCYAPHEADPNTPEHFPMLLFSPEGYVIGGDNLARWYCWQPGRSGLTRLWLNDRYDERVWIAAPIPGEVITARGDGYFGLEILRGRELWGQPVLQRNRLNVDNSNILASPAGDGIWCSGYGDVQGFSTADGSPRWSAAGPAGMALACLDARRGVVYVAYEDERLEARDAREGNLRWTYDWHALVPDEERQKLQAFIGNGKDYRARVASLAASDQGVVLVLSNSRVVSLDSSGRELWLHEADSALAGAVCFHNGILLEQITSIPRRASERDGFARRGELLLPPWPGLRGELAQAGINLPAYSEDQIRGVMIGGQPGAIVHPVRFSVLDPASGAELDALEPGLDYSIGPVPAYNMVVGGGGRRILESLSREEQAPRLLQAYDWIEWEGP